MPSNKQRLDTLLVDRCLAENQERAKRLILAGEVLVGGESNLKPGRLIPTDSIIKIKQPLRYVSRGGLKLEKALQVFDVDVCGKVAIDVGASTGGFTDCLLQHGVKFVYAVDVGYGQLAWRLRRDPRVQAIERTNIRQIDTALFNQPIQIGVIDVSFISLQKVLPMAIQLVEPTGDIFALIKPQFEAGREQVGEGGVVRQPQIHIQVIQRLIEFARDVGNYVVGLTYSPIRGPAGNIEYFLWLKRGPGVSESEWHDLTPEVVQQAQAKLAKGNSQ